MYSDLIDITAKTVPLTDGSKLTAVLYNYKSGSDLEPYHADFLKRIAASEKSFKTQAYSMYPLRLDIPSMDHFGFKTLNRLAGLPIGFVGIIIHDTTVDGMTYTPGAFTFHDFAHNSNLNKLLPNYNAPWNQQNVHCPVCALPDETIISFYHESLKRNELRSFMEISLQGLDKRQTTLAEAFYFNCLHEAYSFEKFTHFELLNHLRTYIKEFGQGKDNHSRFLSRINNVRDFGQASALKAGGQVTPHEMLDITNAMLKNLSSQGSSKDLIAQFKSCREYLK